MDYRQRTPEAGFALADAVLHRPAAPPLPSPLPAEPAPPMSYMHQFSEQVDATVLSYRDQNHLLADLRGYLSEEDDRDTALQLIRALRRRQDIGMNVAKEIDQILAREPGTGTTGAPSGQVPPASSTRPHVSQQSSAAGYPRSQPTPAQHQPTPTYQPPPRTQSDAPDVPAAAAPAPTPPSPAVPTQTHAQATLVLILGDLGTLLLRGHRHRRAGSWRAA